LTVADSAAPIVPLGQNFQSLVSTHGGTAPFRWALVGGALPPGLSLDEAGVIRGRAEALGAYAVDLTVTDAEGQTARGALRFRVVEAEAAASAEPSRATLASQWAGRTGTAAPESSPNVRARNATPAQLTPLAELPALVSALASVPEGSWVKVNANLFSEVWTPEALRPIERNSGGVGSPSAILGAWGSFAWDTRRGDVIVYGGGHANYGGNEIYRWRGVTRKWERASLPSQIALDARNNYKAVDGPDNAPVSAHTYDNNVYLPQIDRFLTFGGAAYNNGDAYLRDNGNGGSRVTGPYLWDPTKADPMKVGGTTGSHVQRVAAYPEVVGGAMWQNRDLPVNLAGTPSLPSAHVEGCTGTGVENGKDVVYVGARLGGGIALHLFRYVINDVNAPSADNWTKVGAWVDTPVGQTVCSYDPERKLMVRLGSKTRPFIFWDVNTPSATYYGNPDKVAGYTEAGGGLAAALNAGTFEISNCALDFDPVRRNHVLWCGASNVWRLTPPATNSTTGWTLVREVAAVGPTPTTAMGVGLLGKWKYIPNVDAFMALQISTEGHVWLYKPTGWQPPGTGGGANQAPTVAITAPANGTTVNAGAALTVTLNPQDSDGVVRQVVVFENGSAVATLTQSPWQVTRTAPANGTLTYTATATDDQGASSTSAAITVNVLAANQAPTVALTAPTANQQFTAGQAITLTATPADPEGQIASVAFYRDGNVLGTLTQGPWTYTWLGAPEGVHQLTARVTDMGGLSTLSPSVSVQVVPASGGGTTLSVVLQQGLDGYTGARDATVYRYWPTTKLGTRESLTEQSGDYVPLVRFAVFAREGGPVPDNATIVSAQLQLYKSNVYAATFSATRLLCDWDETNVNWVQCRNGLNWTSAGALSVGADLVSAPDATAAVPWGAGWLSLDVTSGLQVVQAGAPNHGWRLRRTAGDSINEKTFRSREYSANAAQRPKLSITYSTP